MESRFHAETMVFRRPFRLGRTSATEPAGTYVVETEEALIEGVSFPVWRRVSTTIALQGAAITEVIPVDPAALAAARAADATDPPDKE